MVLAPSIEGAVLVSKPLVIKVHTSSRLSEVAPYAICSSTTWWPVMDVTQGSCTCSFGVNRYNASGTIAESQCSIADHEQPHVGFLNLMISSVQTV